VHRGAVCWSWLALAVLVLCGPVFSQTQAPSEKLLISAKSAAIWSAGGTQVIQLEGSVSVTLDHATLSARQAVIWLSPVPSGAPGQQHADFALFGDATVKQDIATRSGDQLMVSAEVLGDGQITAEQRVARDVSDSPLYRRALDLRRLATTQPIESGESRPAVGIPVPGAATRGAGSTRPAEPGFPVHFEAGRTEVVETEEGTVAVAMWDGVLIRVFQANGDLITMQSQRAVLFTSFTSLREMGGGDKASEGGRKVTAVYLEGDTRMVYDAVRPTVGEQRLRAERVYYELATDRAILADAVLHTVLPAQQVPVIVRARTIRQLTKKDYLARNVELTSSAFAVPSYAIRADRITIHEEDTVDRQYPHRVEFEADNATFRAFNVPFFYLPVVTGSIGDRPGPLRQIGIGHRNDFGYSFLSEWGLFETFGQTPPRSLDAAYRLDYLERRGPGVGLDASYGGGFLTEPQHDPWNFRGGLRSYFVYDRGADKDYGRLPVKDEGPGAQFRGRVVYEHQHFFPDDWQAQIRLGYLSDPTFMEEYFPRQFMEDGPIDESAYIKRQRDTEAFSLLVEAQPNRLITTSERMAEQFEVQRLPEIGYHREGDSFFDNAVTTFSENTASGLSFQRTRATLRQQGFRAPTLLPGIPALGQTGVPNGTTWRADFREEVDWPIDAGHFKVVPYLVGRYTQYSDSPGGNTQARFLGAAGARASTTFWKVDPTAESDLFDIHQLRHVVEPTLDVFASGTTVDRNHLFLYDSQVDAINDISAVKVGLHQRWQTQRGGPERWRSVDFFTLDVDLQFFANKPRGFNFLNPYDFRGAFFSSLPEASIPRNSANLGASWRLNDSTVVLGDAQYNLDARKLATAAVGVLVTRDVTQSWYIGNRYIADLNSNIASIQFQYQISPKYTIGLGQDFDFGLGQNVSSSVSVIRYFDRFVMVFNFAHQQIGNQNGFSFAIAPIGLGFGVSSDTIQGPFRK
jgi:hypothetical protein